MANLTRNTRKEKVAFRKATLKAITAFIKAVKNSGIIGSVTTAKIATDIEVVSRGKTNKEYFDSRHFTNYGSRFPLMEFDHKIKQANIACSFILWNVPRYGEVLTTRADMQNIIEKAIREIAESIVEMGDFYSHFVKQTLIDLGVEWVKASTYNDAPGSVSSIFSYVDEDDNHISIYLNGMVTVNNIEEEGISDEEIALHICGEVFRRLKRKGRLFF